MTTDVTKSRLALRGIDMQDDDAYRRMLPWSRLAFAVGGTQALIASLTCNADMFWQMVPVAALAVIMPHHLVEYVYNHGIRRITKTAPLPANKAPVRFAFFMATIMLALAAASHDAGMHVLGAFFGLQVALVAGLFVFTGFCVPAAIWAFFTGNKCQIGAALRAGQTI